MHLYLSWPLPVHPFLPPALFPSQNPSPVSNSVYSFPFNPPSALAFRQSHIFPPFPYPYFSLTFPPPSLSFFPPSLAPSLSLSRKTPVPSSPSTFPSLRASLFSLRLQSAAFKQRPCRVKSKFHAVVNTGRRGWGMNGVVRGRENAH